MSLASGKSAAARSAQAAPAFRDNRRTFFRYLPAPPEAALWGVAVTAGGTDRIPAHASYPPAGHPEDHSFDWSRGRTLPAMQILLIRKGRGVLETGLSGQHRLSAGTCFVLFPGVWHRYRPDPETGWSEAWVELRGPLVDRLVAANILHPAEPVHLLESSRTMDATFRQAHALLRHRHAYFNPLLSAIGAQLLALLAGSVSDSRPATRIDTAVSRAQHLLAERLGERVLMPELAREIGVAYSYFRREFLRRTGYSPKSYFLQLKMDAARRLLDGTSHSLEEIAEQLGFSSAFHLSIAFKKVYKISPSEWRQREVHAAPHRADLP